MKTRTIVEAALSWSGKYDIPGESVSVGGWDMYGKPITETIPAVDTQRLQKDVDAVLKTMSGQND